MEDKQIIIAESKTTPLRIRVHYTDNHITRGQVLRPDRFNRIGAVDYWSTSTLNIITDEHKVKTDPIVNQVVESFQNRSRVGIKKYGTTLEENNTDDFYQHLSEELMDSLLYLQKLKSQSDTLLQAKHNELIQQFDKLKKEQLEYFSEVELINHLGKKGYSITIKREL